VKNRRRATGKELLFLLGFSCFPFFTFAATTDWDSLGIYFILGFGIFMPILIVFAYFYGVKVE
jgi:hypothetical protein